MQNSFYGYIRVSSKQQNEDRQRIALINCGVPQENIYMDKQSGINFERPQYQNLLKRLQQGDTLIVKRYGLKAIFTNKDRTPKQVLIFLSLILRVAIL